MSTGKAFILFSQKYSKFFAICEVYVSLPRNSEVMNNGKQVIRGKSPVSMQMAKRLYKIFNIDPKLILEYA